MSRPGDRPPRPGLFEITDFNAEPSPGFVDWLAETNVALAFTSGNRLFLIGRTPAGAVEILERSFEAAAGLAAVAADTMFLATRWQLWRLQDALAKGETDRTGHDRLYLPQAAHTTGFLGVHDVAVGGDGRPVFTNQLFNCLATVSERLHFTATWTPSFISALVPEDRCHLTGVCVDDGKPAYVTCAAPTDTDGGWRERASDGGLVIDVRTDEVVAEGLCLPHSPRVHGDGQVFVANGGASELLALDRRGGSDVVARVPGLARGLALWGDWAVLGSSQIRPDDPYAQLGVRDSVRPPLARHALHVIDLRGGSIEHHVGFAGASGEVVGVVVLPETVRPGLPESTGGGLVEPVSIGPWEPSA